MNSRNASVIVVTFLFTFSAEGLAAWGDCNTTSEEYLNTTVVRNYRINVESFDQISGITREEGRQAVILAAEAWNEQANAGLFKYVGTTTRTELPPSEGSCSGIDYSVVSVVGGDCTGNYAGSRCDNGDDEGPVFMLGLCKYLSWFTGSVPSSGNKFELAKVITHELGHTFNIGHPDEIKHEDPEDPSDDHACGQSCSSSSDCLTGMSCSGSVCTCPSPLVCQNSGSDYGNCTQEAALSPNSVRENAGRDLYQYDIECANEIAGDRDLTGYRVTQNSNGTFNTPTSFTGSYNVAKVSAGVYYSNGGVGGTYQGRSATIKDDTHWVWLKNQSVPYYTIPYIMYDYYSTWRGDEDLASIGPREAVWREDPDRQRVLYSSYFDYPTKYGKTSKHRVKYSRFQSPDFISTGYWHLEHCYTMTGWFSCSSTRKIYSGKPVAVAWDGDAEKSVIVWANQDRLNSNTTSREVNVSVGYISNLLLPQPTSLGKRTRVGPAVACKDASGYNCILAYVDQEGGTSGTVWVRRFNNSVGTNRYTTTFDSTAYGLPSTSRTGSSIAAWYNSSSNYFYIAIKAATYSQPLYVFRSSTGTSWSLYKFIDYPLIGPTVASYHDGSTNVLVYAK